MLFFAISLAGCGGSSNDVTTTTSPEATQDALAAMSTTVILVNQ
jgi:hypothetical protein